MLKHDLPILMLRNFTNKNTTYYRLDGDGSYTVKYGDFSFTSSFDLDVDLVRSGAQDNFEFVVLGCEDTFELNLPAFADNNDGFKRSDLLTTGVGNDGDCPTDGEVLVTLSGRLDRFSEEENGLALIDSDYLSEFLNGDSVKTEMFVGKGGFSNNQEVNMKACVDVTKCYVFFFFDSYNDGLTHLDSNGLTMSMKSPTTGIHVQLFTMLPDTPPKEYITLTSAAWYEFMLNCEL